MTETKQTSTTKTDRRPDCVTEIRMGNSVLETDFCDSVLKLDILFFEISLSDKP